MSHRERIERMGELVRVHVHSANDLALCLAPGDKCLGAIEPIVKGLRQAFVADQPPECVVVLAA